MSSSNLLPRRRPRNKGSQQWSPGSWALTQGLWVRSASTAPGVKERNESLFTLAPDPKLARFSTRLIQVLSPHIRLRNYIRRIPRLSLHRRIDASYPKYPSHRRTNNIMRGACLILPSGHTHRERAKETLINRMMLFCKIVHVLENKISGHSKLNRQQAQSSSSESNIPSGHPGTKECDPMHRLIELAEYRVEPRRVSREPRNRFRAPGDLRQRVDCRTILDIYNTPFSFLLSYHISYISPSFI
jgi:hypothetical protein